MVKRSIFDFWSFTSLTLPYVFQTFVGALVDGIMWNIVDHNRACYSPSTFNYYGQSDYYDQAYSCYEKLLYVSPGYCYCVEANNNLCFHYDISDSSHYNCGDVLGYYTQQLQYSTIFCSILIPICLSYVILSCSFGAILCCRKQPTPQTIETNTLESVETAMPHAIAYAVQD